ncbi:thiosulfate sulfurtransferase [Hyaloraphidium curvatum]|nr:thiosulfate sulfurtransferase [Hyaloraphidium curvatum]
MAAPPLVDTNWLAARLSESLGDNLRIIDATVFLDGKTRSGREDFEKEHIGRDDQAAFADLLVDLADKRTTVWSMLPGPEQFAAEVEALGIGDSTKYVVLYDRSERMWSTRLYWMLYSYGFRNASVLDGGLEKWKEEGRPLFSGPGSRFPPGKVKFTPKLDASLWADKEDLKQAISNGSSATCVVNALSPENHVGRDTSYQRPGRIPGAKNVWYLSILKPDGTYQNVEALRQKFSFAKDDQRVVTYCGGGIAATSDAFVLRFLLNHPKVAVYDGSLIDWTADPNLPLVVGEDTGGKL